MTALCRFERISPTRIRCATCKTEREFSKDPAEYRRNCGSVMLPAEVLSPESHPLTDPCLHFGPVIRQGICDVCGHRGKPYDVHACAIHGECQLRRMQARGGPKWCGNCGDYKPRGSE